MACTDGLSVHFPKGDAELNLDAVGKVLLTVSTLEACPASRAIVTGYSESGEVKTLAGTRAANVAAVITKNGIDGRRVVIGDGSGPARDRREPDNRFVSISWK